MKRIIKVFGLIALIILVTGCETVMTKTEYNYNEEAILDNIELKLIEAKSIENDSIEVVFSITNKRDNTITLSPDTNFKLYDINHVQIPNKYTTNTNIIKANETINYTLQYNSKKEIYEILFYSGIVENNIKFTFTSLDVK